MGERDNGQDFDNGAFWTNHATGDDRCRDLLRRDLTEEEREAVRRARRRLDPGPLYDPET